MAKKPEITVAEIIHAIQEISKATEADGAATTKEISDATGLSLKRTRAYLQQLMSQGNIVRCYKTKDTLAGERQVLAFKWREANDQGEA